jgi:adenylate kinase family enzyme
LNRSQDKVSIPTEFILALLKREIAKVGRKAVFIDGLPRTLDQISTALYFRDLINFRDDPDFFVLIDVPMAIIDARLKKRVVCPECRLARNLDFNPTGYVNYDAKSDEYFLLCDNSSCLGMGKTRLVTKDGDAAGIETIKERIESDGELIRLALNLTGVPKVLLRSSIPVSVAPNYVESFEIQPKFSYTWNGSTVEIHNSPWTFEDDAGVSSYSLMAPPVVVSMFEQVYKILIG